MEKPLAAKYAHMALVLLQVKKKKKTMNIFTTGNSCILFPSYLMSSNGLIYKNKIKEKNGLLIVATFIRIHCLTCSIKAKMELQINS